MFPKSKLFLHHTHHCKRSNEAQSLENFLEANDNVDIRNPKMVDGTTQVSLINDFTTKGALFSKLDVLDLLNPERLRPSWDSYFMVHEPVCCTAKCTNCDAE